MGHTLEQFAAECHRILKANPGPTGRQQVCTMLQEALKDEAFGRNGLRTGATSLPSSMPGRRR